MVPLRYNTLTWTRIKRYVLRTLMFPECALSSLLVALNECALSSLFVALNADVGASIFDHASAGALRSMGEEHNLSKAVSLDAGAASPSHSRDQVRAPKLRGLIELNDVRTTASSSGVSRHFSFTPARCLSPCANSFGVASGLVKWRESCIRRFSTRFMESVLAQRTSGPVGTPSSMDVDYLRAVLVQGLATGQLKMSSPLFAVLQQVLRLSQEEMARIQVRGFWR